MTLRGPRESSFRASIGASPHSGCSNSFLAGPSPSTFLAAARAGAASIYLLSLGETGRAHLKASPVALLLIDVINPMDFDGAGAVLPCATRAAANIGRLKRRAREANIPVVYVFCSQRIRRRPCPQCRAATASRNHTARGVRQAVQTRRATRSRTPSTISAACSVIRSVPAHSGHGIAVAMTSTSAGEPTGIGRAGRPPG